MKVIKRKQYQQIIEKDLQANRYSKGDLLLSYALAMVEQIENDQPEKVLIACGNGENGDIGLLIAGLLARKTAIKPTLIHFSIASRPLYSFVDGATIEVVDDIRKARDVLPRYEYIVDCIFGMELDEAIYFPYTYLIEWINQSKAYKLSCDLPSGLNCDNGQDYGCCLQPDTTVTMQLPKLGFYLYPGNVKTGNVIVASTAISQNAIDEIACPYYIHNDSQIRSMLPVRYKHSHKGSYGKVLLIAGSKQTAGACLLCGKAIMKTGAGLLTIMSHKEVLPVINMSFPEAMTIEIDEFNVYYQLENMDFNSYDLIVIGPGLGRYSDCEALLQKTLQTSKTVVIDADGLFYLKRNLELLNRNALTVITPHLGEYQRVFDYDAKTITDDLFEINRRYPNLAVVLKGENTLISYKGQMVINTTGNNAMAKGGSGDVLAGVIGGLLAQKRDIDSVIAGVYVHSYGADLWVKEHSQYSLLASDLIEMVDKALMELSISQQ